MLNRSFWMRLSVMMTGFSVVIAFTSVVRAADAASLGFDSVRLQRLDTAIQEQVDRQQIAGGIMFIARDGQTAHLRTYGMQDIEGARPMSPDAIFRIASMSKG